MGMELINRITIKKNAVYLSHKSINDSAPFHSSEYSRLTEIYQTKGRKELDKKLMKLLTNYAELRGKHKSIIPYQKVLDDYYTVGKYPLKTQIYNYQTLFYDKEYDETKVGMPKDVLKEKLNSMENEFYNQLASDVEKYRNEENTLQNEQSLENDEELEF